MDTVSIWVDTVSPPFETIPGRDGFDLVKLLLLPEIFITRPVSSPPAYLE